MRFIVQVRIEPDTDTTSDVIDVAVIERDVLSSAIASGVEHEISCQ